MKYCVHCGAQLPDDAQFCPGCGKAVGDGASPVPARKIPLPALLTVLAVALVAGVVFALTRGGSSQEAPGAPQSGESTATVTATASPTPTETPVASPAPPAPPQPAHADGSKDVEISYTVTEDMLPKASPSPTPSATPHPGKGQPPKTGDESNIMLYGLIASGSLLAGIGLFCYVKNKERTEYTDE